MKKLLVFMGGLLLAAFTPSLEASQYATKKSYNNNHHLSQLYRTGSKKIRQLSKIQSQNVFTRKQFFSNPFSVPEKKAHYCWKSTGGASVRTHEEGVVQACSSRAWFESPIVTFLVFYLLLIKNMSAYPNDSAQLKDEKFRAMYKMISTSFYREGAEEEVNGPINSLKKPFDGWKLSDHIGPRYVVTSCLYPTVTGPFNPKAPAFSHCLSFDGAGPLGDLTAQYDTALEDYLDAEKVCDTTHVIASEATKLTAALLNPVQLQNDPVLLQKNNGTFCSIHNLNLDVLPGYHTDVTLAPSSAESKGCTVHVSDISYTSLLPTFMKAFRDLCTKLRLKTKLHVWLVDEEVCDPSLRMGVATVRLDSRSHSGVRQEHGLWVPYSFLQKFSDGKQIAAMGDILYGEKQREWRGAEKSSQLNLYSGNNLQLERGISTALTSDEGLCYAGYLKDIFLKGLARQELMHFLTDFRLTRDNIVKVLEGASNIPLTLAYKKQQNMVHNVLLQAKKEGVLKRLETEKIEEIKRWDDTPK